MRVRPKFIATALSYGCAVDASSPMYMYRKGSWATYFTGAMLPVAAINCCAMVLGVSKFK